MMLKLFLPRNSLESETKSLNRLEAKHSEFKQAEFLLRFNNLIVFSSLSNNWQMKQNATMIENFTQMTHNEQL